MRETTIIFYSFISLLFGFQSKCNKMPKAEISYYRDFDRINVKGIGPFQGKPDSFPYVQYEKYPDGQIVVKFYLDKRKVYTKKYFIENGVLTCILIMNMHDAGCLGFTERQYFFEPNKMISYTYCGKHAPKEKSELYYVAREQWNSVLKDYIKQQVYTKTFRNNKNYNFSLDCREDFYGPLFSDEGTKMVEEKWHIADTEILWEKSECWLRAAGKKNCRYDNKDTYDLSRQLYSVWDLMEDYTSKLPPF
jgi:hypothetical protein